MQYIELRKVLKDFTVFSLIDIKNVDNSFHRRRLSEWQDKGYIKKVLKGYYIFSDLELDENSLFEIANRIYQPSYISCETALSYYGLIPESVYGITSVSARRTYKFKSQLAEFSYRTVAPHLFLGYDIVQYGNKTFKIACIEKSLLDYFYLNTHKVKEDDFLALRMDKPTLLKKVDKSKFDLLLKRFQQKRLKRRMKIFWETVVNA